MCGVGGRGRIAAMGCTVKNFRPAVWVLGVVWLAATALAQAGGVAAADLGRRCDELVRRETLGQFWGAVLVADKGKVVLSRGYGLANREMNPVGADSLFDIGSISKAFTATGILRLASEGKLRVDGAIGLYLPGVPEHAGGITVAHLLSHTSGVTGGEDLRLDTPEDLVRSVLAPPLKFEPGSRMEYSNAGYFLLAAIIERVGKMPYEKFIAQEVLAPAGMVHSSVIGLPEVDPGAVTDRVDAETARRGRAMGQPYMLAWGYKGAGGVVSSASDLLAFDRALRGNGLLDELSKGRMFKAGKGGYGFGWFVSATGAGWRHEHSGAVWGYGSELIRHEDGTVIIVLTNGRNNPVALGAKLEALVKPELSAEIRVTIQTGGLRLDGHKLVRFPDSGGARVRRQGGAAGLVLFDRAEPGKDLVVAEIPASRCKAIAAQLREVCQDGPAGAGASGMLWIATAVYTPDAQGTIALPEDVRLIVQGEFQSHSEDGGSVEEHRPTLILSDDAHSFWPVIFVMDPSIARELAGELEK